MNGSFFSEELFCSLYYLEIEMNFDVPALWCLGLENSLRLENCVLTVPMAALFLINTLTFDVCQGVDDSVLVEIFLEGGSEFTAIVLDLGSAFDCLPVVLLPTEVFALLRPCFSLLFTEIENAQSLGII